ncbi:assimilatory sulfite reductase (NADPH) flavoprotein subunit [Paracoccus sp. PARArs4]|uniref:assimilatory sulfite reductase (NADPH) flavoprotein subunit n=1 Tax=Paracoccus sp. PARArs4 TaxID=2853442 RepID=UPI0024A645B4|nr:assimilatory sulfite reductase (NADPH) flavoprotein subunit [Paracoccus sp. PARArs4]
MLTNTLPPGLNPLTPEQSTQMQTLLTTLTPIQQAWISGFLAATAGAAGATAVQAPAQQAEKAVLTVLYGSQTGNAKHVAQDVAAKAKARGLDVKLVDMADYKPNQLKNERYMVVVVSTYGEGEPPEPALKLFDFVGSKKAPKLDGTKIAVLGLGDTSYEFFCKTAVDFEERLTALGATVLVERALLDVDYDDHAAAWIDGTVDAFEPDLKADAQPSNVVPLTPGMAAPAPAASQWTKKNPFTAEVNAVQKITGRDSTKDVRHLEVSLEGSGITYQAGDSLGVYFHNDPVEVDETLALLNLDGAAEVTVGGQQKTLREALTQDLELTQSYPTFVEKFAEATDNDALRKLASDKAALREYIADRQIFDILREHKDGATPQSLVDSLRKMQPRLYSIASSQKEAEDEVHVTVGVVEYNAHGRNHLGGASGHLGRRLADAGELRVFVEENNNFRLPADPDAPVIMIGPGTGIAPFRAFLQDRDADGASGRNWLFFGNPHFTQDFLYQVELQGYLKSGLLTKLDVAFSRDQAEKVYVQHRIVEQGAELWKWLDEGAHLYICGDADRMAKDVHDALIQVLVEHGKHSVESAEAFLVEMRDNRRYQRDVY